MPLLAPHEGNPTHGGQPPCWQGAQGQAVPTGSPGGTFLLLSSEEALAPGCHPPKGGEITSTVLRGRSTLKLVKLRLQDLVLPPAPSTLTLNSNSLLHGNPYCDFMFVFS